MLLLVSCSKETVPATRSAVEPPQAVMQTFTKAYPNAEKARWIQAGEDFQVEFEQNAREGEIRYSKAGAVLMTEMEIATDALPEAIRLVLANDYPNIQVEEVDRITKGGEVMYEVELDTEESSLEIMFTEDGKVLGIENEDDDDYEGDGEDDEGEDDDN